MENQKKAYLYALITVLLWSTVASAFKISLRSLDVIQLVWYSTLTSVLVLLAILAITRKVALLKSFSKKDHLYSMVLGFLNPFLYYLVLFKAYSLLPAQQAQPLNYFWPIVLALLSVFWLKQKIGLKNLLAIVISFIGMVVVSTQGSLVKLRDTNFFGIGLALGSTAIWSVFWILNIKDKQDAVVRLFMNFVFGLFFTSIALLLFSRVVVPPRAGLGGAVYVGAFEMGLPFVFWLRALRLSETTARVSNLIYLSPFLSLVFIRLVVKERILISTVIGLVLIVAGIIIQQYNKPRSLP
jgi:drug/metabolite transporter (DMT)-like permease